MNTTFQIILNIILCLIASCVGFCVLILIIWLIMQLIDLIKRPFEKKVDQIRKQYPLAYYDFIEKNHISSFETSIIKLIRIIRSSSDWNETEERLKEQKKRKEIANSFNKWEKEQEEYRNNCLIIAKETMSNFGWYYYDIPFTKLNEREEAVQGKYKVWQFFPGAYCLESDLDYSDFVSIKNNTKDIIRFKSKEVCWPESVYEKINAFINELAKKYQISVYLNANKEEWSSESLNYHYNDIFESEFVSDKIEIYNSVFDPILNGEPLNSKLNNRHIIIIDMQTENGQLKSVCKRIIDNNKAKHPLITYISLLKGYDREEMIDLINKEKKKRQEEEELRRKEREEEEIRKAELKKIEEEQEERNRLKALANFKKTNSQIFIEVLQQHGISCLYHFTDESNLESIKEHGGLFSWSYCDEHGITIPMPGGGGLSRMLDKSRGLQDYVRLCFTKNHPMMYVARNEGRIKDPVLLKIDLEVVTIDSTKFSNKNATIKRESVNIGNTLDDLKQIHFDTVKCNTHFDLADEEKSYFQAEVLVKTFVPIKYIKNIDYPLYV